MLAATGLALLIPQFIRFIIDQGIEKGDMALLTRSVFGLLGLTVLKGVISYGQGRLTETASQGVAYDLRRDIHRKLAALSFSYHDRAETGQLLSRAVQDVERVRFLTGRAFLRLAEGVVLAAATIVVMYLMSPGLATLTMVIIPLLAVNAYHFGRQLRPLGLRLQRQLAVLTTRLEQNLRARALSSRRSARRMPRSPGLRSRTIAGSSSRPSRPRSRRATTHSSPSSPTWA